MATLEGAGNTALGYSLLKPTFSWWGWREGDLLLGTWNLTTHHALKFPDKGQQSFIIIYPQVSSLCFNPSDQ